MLGGTKEPLVYFAITVVVLAVTKLRSWSSCIAGTPARRAEALLPDYPCTDGDEPVVVDVAGAPPITYNITVPTTPVFPCDVVTWRSSVETRELFARTIETILQQLDT